MILLEVTAGEVVVAHELHATKLAPGTGVVENGRAEPGGRSP